MSIDILNNIVYHSTSVHDSMAKSDIDESSEHPTSPGNRKSTAILDKSEDSTIHSGHFMKSRVHIGADDDDNTDDNSQHSEDKNTGYDFDEAVQQPSESYNFVENNPIDGSLTKLFQCMTLAYRFV